MTVLFLLQHASIQHDDLLNSSMFLNCENHSLLTSLSLYLDFACMCIYLIIDAGGDEAGLSSISMNVFKYKCQL